MAAELLAAAVRAGGSRHVIAATAAALWRVTASLGDVQAAGSNGQLAGGSRQRGLGNCSS